VTYEAGPTGFGLARAFSAAGIRCEVAAPSKLQRPSGHRVKTDRNDARWLCQLLRLDQIVSVRVPTAEQEATRDLVRAREDARGDLMRARHRVSKLLLRHGLVYPRKAWTRPHHDWLTGIRFDRRSTQLAFEADLDAVLLTTARRDRLDKIIDTLAADCEYTAVTRRLGCLRGVSTLTGFTLAVEIGDWDRFTAKTIGAYLGLVPTEHSSGGSRRQGHITKAGNSHVRRLLVEAALHHRRPYQPSQALQSRWELASPAAKTRGHQANQRLHDRWDTFTTQRKRPVVANVAIARELAGWCWSLATLPG